MKSIGCLLIFLFFTQLLSQKSPDEYFKKAIGSDKTLIAYPQIIKYFKHLEQNSARIKLTDEW
jgi:hypothetical protein